ncbi:MAG TPA: tetratricopeptide repeat protein, partial [Thermoanaerobaculia bacterium]
MKGYSVRDVGTMLGLSPGQVRSYVATGFLSPERGPRGEYRFTFQDLVLLRTAKGLVAARIPPRKVRQALEQLKEQLPTGRPLTAVRIAAQGDRVVVQDGGTVWNPESGQVLFDFAVSELATKVAPHAERVAEQARREEHQLEAEDWYELGCEMEITSPREARDAYRRAVELDPHHSDAHVNLGRLLHEAGEVEAAAAHYRIAVSLDDDHSTAAFNLGVALED